MYRQLQMYHYLFFFFLKENKPFVLKAENSPHIVDVLMDYFKLNTIGGKSSVTKRFE